MILSDPVRTRVVLKYSGQLALMLAVLTLAPLLVSIWHGELALALRYLTLVVLLSLGGTLLSRCSAPPRIQANEALTIIVLAFLVSPLLMSWPMASTGIPYPDALFEAISGVTTTGLTTLGSIQDRSPTFLFARAWMQWYGGLGIVVLSVALLMGHQAAVRRLVEPATSGDTLIAASHTYARQSLVVYLALTSLSLLALWVLTGDGFTALLHTLAAVSTGGFSSFDDSLAAFGSDAATLVVLIAAACGAVSLSLYYRASHGNWRAALADPELHTLLVAGILVGALLGLLGWHNDRVEPWYHGLMLAFSAQTTAGFSTLDVNTLDTASQAMLIFSMLTGGSIGSTAGGIKLLRLLILLRLVQLTVRRATMPMHAVDEPRLAGQRLENDDLLRALVLVILFLTLVALSWLAFLAYGYDPLSALFEVVSASGTVGLSTGISRPELEPLLKGILCFDMLAGRLEIVALLVVLYPRNWLGRRGESQ
jgi:trk system potassium uptake protein TrkH